MTEVLDPGTWRSRRAEHHARVDAWTAGHRERAGRGLKHPVEDFLFTYYSHGPARLRRWSPGPGVVLREHPVEPPYVAAVDGVALPPAPERVRRTAGFVGDLLRRTAERSAQLGCFGLHEWAMTYRGERRHEDWPLRLGQDGTDEVVDTLGLRCSHHDAFRFFTPSAAPLNLLQPTRDSQAELEQPGCLHANMDLYKWSYKLSPWVASASSPTASTSPGGCGSSTCRRRRTTWRTGLEPVAVETAEGRAEYAKRQAAFSDESAVLRQRLLDQAQALAD